MRIDLTNDALYPPLAGLDPLPKKRVLELEQRAQRRHGNARAEDVGAVFRVIRKDSEGRTVVSDWSNEESLR